MFLRYENGVTSDVRLVIQYTFEKSTFCTSFVRQSSELKADSNNDLPRICKYKFLSLKVQQGRVSIIYRKSLFTYRDDSIRDQTVTPKNVIASFLIARDQHCNNYSCRKSINLANKRLIHSDPLLFYCVTHFRSNISESPWETRIFRQDNLGLDCTIYSKESGTLAIQRLFVINMKRPFCPSPQWNTGLERDCKVRPVATEWTRWKYVIVKRETGSTCL
jgi:hypothetical protein